MKALRISDNTLIDIRHKMIDAISILGEVLPAKLEEVHTMFCSSLANFRHAIYKHEQWSNAFPKLHMQDLCQEAKNHVHEMDAAIKTAGRGLFAGLFLLNKEISKIFKKSMRNESFEAGVRHFTVLAAIAEIKLAILNDIKTRSGTTEGAAFTIADTQKSILKLFKVVSSVSIPKEHAFEFALLADKMTMINRDLAALFSDQKPEQVFLNPLYGQSFVQTSPVVAAQEKQSRRSILRNATGAAVNRELHVSFFVKPKSTKQKQSTAWVSSEETENLVFSKR